MKSFQNILTSVFYGHTLHNYFVWKSTYSTQGKTQLSLRTNNVCKCPNVIESDEGKSQQKRETDKTEKLNKL